MALRFIDGFDHYVTADLVEKWTSNDFCTIHATNGRRSTGCMTHADYGSFVTRTLDNQAIWIVGMAMRITGLPLAAGAAIIQWRDGATPQVELQVSPGGQLAVYRQTTLLGTATGVLTLSAYQYIEFYVRIHGTLGEAHVHVDGVSVLSLTSLNTQMTSNAYASTVRIGNSSSNSTHIMGTQSIDDVYICDGTGSAPQNTFLGDCRVDCLFPSADGSNSAWTCSTGTAHAALTDETAPNDDTDYLSSVTAAARDTHAMGNLSAMATPTILGVQHVMSAKKEDAGTCAIKNVLKSGATTEAGATSHALSTSYAYYRELWMTDPNTSAAWTTTAIDAVEAGAEKV